MRDGKSELLASATVERAPVGSSIKHVRGNSPSRPFRGRGTPPTSAVRMLRSRRQGAWSRPREQGMNIEKLTDRARGFVQSAQSLALREGHQQFAPDHLLKVLLDDPEGPRGRADRPLGRALA